MDPFDSKPGMSQVLRALEAALGYTRAALLAAHPELREERLPGRQPLKLDAASWAADEVLTHLSGLAGAVAGYLLEAERKRTRLLLVTAGRPARGRAA